MSLRMRTRRLAVALVLCLAACGNPGVAQVGPTLPDVTEDGRLELNGRVMNVLEQPIATVTATLTILHVSGTTYVETADLLAEDEEPLAPFESVAFHLESSVAIDEIEDYTLSFDSP